MQLIIITITLSFVLNFIWENLHASLYLHHKNRKITQKILFIATLGDVIILSFFTSLWYFIPLLQSNKWFVIPLGLFVALAIEKYAFMTKRWAYDKNMPILPYLNIGISPFIQLSCTSYVLLAVLELFI